MVKQSVHVSDSQMRRRLSVRESGVADERWDGVPERRGLHAIAGSQ